jgi:PKD repeat protein
MNKKSTQSKVFTRRYLVNAFKGAVLCACVLLTFSLHATVHKTDTCDTKADFSYVISGNTVTLTSISSGTGVLSHNWIFDGKYISRDSITDFTFDSAGIYEICLLVDARCGADKICKIINVGNSPCNTKADFTYVITGKTVTVKSTSTGTGQLWHNWSFDGHPDNTGDRITEFTFDSAGTYDICLLVDASCGADEVCKTITIEDDACKTKADFTYVVTGNTITVTSTSSGKGQLWHNWIVDGQIISRDSVTDITFDSAGTYEICLLVDARCGADRICKTISMNTSGVSTSLVNKISVYPNPASDYLYISAATGNMGKIKLINSLGDIVFSSEAGFSAIDLRDFASGLYLITLTDSEARVTILKVFKQ